MPTAYAANLRAIAIQNGGRMLQKIIGVVPGSIAEELGIEPGDTLVAIDGQEIDDVLDYYFYTDSGQLELCIRGAGGEEWLCDIEKEEKEDLGLLFEEQFMGKYRHCQNKCIFCFIDQLPKGMRDTLYFKDDDARLSFLNGNYITLTNMREADFQKVIRYHMSPINVSVHTTNPELRVSMLGNPKAAAIMEPLRRLAEAGITLNGQIVLCKGVNDREELDRTIADLGGLIPAMASVSIVPVGLSRHREGLYPLEPFTREDADALIRQIEPYREKFWTDHGTHFVHLSDEFYRLAERPLPEEEAYDGYPQIENGVGMLRLFWNEAVGRLEELAPDAGREADVSLVTAPCAAMYIEQLVQRVQQVFPKVRVHTHCIVNHYFGDHITVTGLLTGRDIVGQLREQERGRKLLLPENLLRDGQDVLLDDMSIREIEEALQMPVDIVKSSGRDFIDKIIGEML